MKKCLTICLILPILLANTPTNRGVQAIVKMGAFFHHFAHHLVCQQEQIDISDFVRLHYFNHEHHQTNHVEHDKLPFQHDHQSRQNMGEQISLLLFEPQINAALPKLEPISTPLIARLQHWLSVLHTGKIWQPPKA